MQALDARARLKQIAQQKSQAHESQLRQKLLRGRATFRGGDAALAGDPAGLNSVEGQGAADLASKPSGPTMTKLCQAWSKRLAAKLHRVYGRLSKQQ
jgi:hypothetical protein